MKFLDASPDLVNRLADWHAAGFSRRLSMVILFVAVLLPGMGWTGAEQVSSTDADRQVREVFQNEIQGEADSSNLWAYRELTKRKGKELLFEYCQTRYGTIDRLLAVNGAPLDPSERQAETKRIQKLIASPGALRAAQKKEESDDEQLRKFLKLFPDAFRYHETQQQGDQITLRFEPNPDFSAPGFEARVLHSLQGTIVVDVKQKRLVSVDARLMTVVKFWAGVLGHLDQGGTFSVVTENVSPGDREMKSLNVEINGKAVIFKTVAFREHDAFSDYTPVSRSMTLAQAAEWLEKKAP
jgi:hypothetical protein